MEKEPSLRARVKEVKKRTPSETDEKIEPLSSQRRHKAGRAKLRPQIVDVLILQPWRGGATEVWHISAVRLQDLLLAVVSLFHLLLRFLHLLLLLLLLLSLSYSFSFNSFSSNFSSCFSSSFSPLIDHMHLLQFAPPSSSFFS